MIAQSQTTKIKRGHFERVAYIYIRQSTLYQVFHNTASTARQYNLQEYAQALGWSVDQIKIIDEDQARTATSADGRSGFQSMLLDVGWGRVGAIFSLEVSRVARNSADWQQLLKFCHITDTLIIDEEGVYDLNNYNDRLLLGLKGTISEAEEHLIMTRLHYGKLEKARQGELRFRPTTGFVHDRAGRIILDPDEAVQNSFRLLFSLFDQYGSALAVVKHFCANKLLFPTRAFGGARDGDLSWKPLQHVRVISILHNPAYAGAYVYGRSRQLPEIQPGSPPKVKSKKVFLAQKDWKVVFLDAHAGYINWDKYLFNEERLADNLNRPTQGSRGAIRSGISLLQGITLCGVCGQRMRVHYPKSKNYPAYICDQQKRKVGAAMCQRIPGFSVEKAAACLLLEAVKPAQIQLSIAALEEVEAQFNKIRRQSQLNIDRAQYEADLAYRRYAHSDPENRLVVRTLERDWNDKLAEVERVKREHEDLTIPSMLAISEDEHQSIMALAQDLPKVWHSDLTTSSERKELIRLLIKDFTLIRVNSTCRVIVRWQTGALTNIEVELPTPSEIIRTDPDIMARIKELSINHTDQQVAEELNNSGLKTKRGKFFTEQAVKYLRVSYNIPTGCPVGQNYFAKDQRSDGLYTVRAAARLLNVSKQTIRGWRKSGRLMGVQAHADGPYWIKLTPELIEQWKQPAKKTTKLLPSVPYNIKSRDITS